MLSTLVSGSSNSPAKNRVFVYEVTGLKQSSNNDNNNYAFRKSGSIFIQVPYARMNEEMQRISRMGGKIINISPLVISEGGSEDNGSSEE